MNKKLWPFFSLCLLLALSLSACQAVQSAGNVPATLPPTVTAVPTITPTFAPLPSLTPRPTLPPTPAATDLAEKTVQDFFAALEAGDMQEAANCYSSFSLMVEHLTRSEAADHLHAQYLQGTRWSDLALIENRAFDDQTLLVHVTYQLATKDAKTEALTQTEQDEWWPLRQENGQWLYNRGNLIDYRTLEISEKTTGGLTVKPRRMERYTDSIRVTLLVQNHSNEPIVLGQVNEILATFLFNGDKVEAEKAQFVFDRLRSYPDTVLIVKGLYEDYPEELILRQWKNIEVQPWFTFSLVE